MNTPNILLLVADDLGQDVVDIETSGSNRWLYVHTVDAGTHIVQVLTNISVLLRGGVYFEQAWAHPACSPTRAAMYTGLHPWKSGIGSPSNEPELLASTALKTLPEQLPSEYACGLFGKWHLGRQFGTRPTEHGWHRHIGTLDGVLGQNGNNDDNAYTNWLLADSANGYLPTRTSEHATSLTVKAAANWINGLSDDTPWFATLAFHAPHAPFHVPPQNGIDPQTPGNQDSPAYKFNVMTQHLDYSIGQLIGREATIDFDPISRDVLENTVIIFVGDNGSPSEVAREEAKTKIYEGGIRVPMIIADGALIRNDTPNHLGADRVDTSTDELVHLVDLYATIAALAGTRKRRLPDNIDSVDLAELFETSERTPENRSYNFSQYYTESGTALATIRNHKYKLNFDLSRSPQYSLYRYEEGEIPGIEGLPKGVNGGRQRAEDLYMDAILERDPVAAKHLALLHSELQRSYKRDQAKEFPDLPIERSASNTVV